MDFEQTDNRARFEARARAALEDLTRALRRWAGNGDGVPTDAWGAFTDAHYVLGLPMPKPPSDLGPAEALYEMIRATNAWARSEDGLPPEVVASWRAAHEVLGLKPVPVESFSEPDPAVARAHEERAAKAAELDEIYRTRRALQRRMRRLQRRLVPLSVFSAAIVAAVTYATRLVAIVSPRLWWCPPIGAALGFGVVLLVVSLELQDR